MLGKLIAYEFRASGRLIPLVYVVVGLLLIMGAIFSAIGLPVYYYISFFVLLIAALAAMIITYIIIIVRFYKGMYGAEGYLSFTLPVTSAMLYLSKMIVAFCWLLLSTVVTTLAMVASFFMIYRGLEMDLPDYFWEEMIEVFSSTYGGSVSFLGWTSVVMGIIGFVSFIAQIFFCITLANIRPFQKLGVGAAIIAFVCLGIVTTILQNVVPLTLVYDASEGLKIIPHTTWEMLFDYTYYYSNDYVFQAGLMSYLLPLLYAIGLPFLTVHLMNKKINLK